MKTHECVNCGSEVSDDYKSSNETANCQSCGTKYKVNFDAEFDGGWKDLTTIHPVTPKRKTPKSVPGHSKIDKELELYEMRRGLV